jgi:hypothetical protein
MRETIEAAITQVIDFYATQSIEFGERPSFTILEGEYHPDRRILMQVPGELYAMRDLHKVLFCSNVDEAKHAEFGEFGVKVSDNAFNQAIEAQLARMYPYVGLDDDTIGRLQAHEADFLVYQSLTDLLDKNPGKEQRVLARYLAHELWHVHEMRGGVLATFIAEGTANFAGNLYKKGDIKERGNLVQRHLGKSYSKGKTYEAQRRAFTNGINRAVSNHADGLPDLLDLSRRELMKRDGLSFLSEYTASEDALVGSKQILLSMFPEFQALNNGGLSQENLLRVYGTIGFRQIAEELEGQDCSKLVASFRELGF